MFDLAGLQAAVRTHGRVARVVIASSGGSVPREVGAAMLVWPSGQAGTIGGGALEWEAAAHARAALNAGGDRLDKVPLGPGLGQCCGGAVLLLTEVWDASRLATISGNVVVRAMPRFSVEMPMKVAGRLRSFRNGQRQMKPEQIQGWMIEPVAKAQRSLWIWGAGHVGRAIVGIMAPLPGLSVTWIDVASDRFPQSVQEGVTVLPVADPALHVSDAPQDAEHLILTYSHALDLALCHALLNHGFASAGLIGSATKWARFRARLAALGHAPGAIARIRCPIGVPGFGKHPQAIAVGVASEWLQPANAVEWEARA